MRQAWNLAAPHTWPATLIPVALGELYCVAHQYALSLSTAIALTAACLAMQAAVNTLNDYFDFVKGTDKPEDRVAADDAVLVYGQVPPRQALLLGIFLFSGGGGYCDPPVIASGDCTGRNRGNRCYYGVAVFRRQNAYFLLAVWRSSFRRCDGRRYSVGDYCRSDRSMGSTSIVLGRSRYHRNFVNYDDE